ncbi:unnamed protein product [Lactuca saligna]|uniref:PI4-kinase N-terminal domain-containing protein n=1 Tax=Lactuca saligna TaxID=75948 RepID=A0AA36A1I8_LACSI|nr:unnamed protein product [Lactuca saligna]
MLQGTTKLPWKFSHHPAAAGTFFTVMLLGLKFCTCQYEGILQNVRLGIQLLEDGIYRAALGWFAYEPEWFEHDHGNFAHIEAQSVNSFVHYLQNDPKALGGEYGGSFLDMDHCHPVWGPMENYAACRDKRKQLLLMLKIRNRRLQVRFGIESLRFRVRSEASRCRKKKSGGGISRLQNPFVGAAFQSSLKPRNVNCLGYLGNKFPRKSRYDIIPRAKKNDWISHGIRFSQSFGENVEILWKNMGLRSGFVVKSVKEPFTRSKAIVRSLSTIWEEGLLLFQCSIFYAMISVVYNRTLLAAQKRKYLWLGIPFIDGVLQKHLSTEEGIDNRTKIRRNAQEKTAAQSLGESVASSAKASQANNVIVALASSQDLTPELKLTTASQ